MNNLLLSKSTKQNVELFLSNPSHALLIVGSNGSGKLSLARYISAVILGAKKSDSLNQSSNFKILSPIDRTVSIDQIRDLKNFFRLKTTGSNEHRRIAIIENANRMTDEAQNAILKILEEPPSDSVIILTSTSEEELNKTILSRVQIIRIFKPTISQTISFFTKQSYADSDIKKNYILSNGSVGLLSKLLEKSSSSEMKTFVEESKSILVSSRIEKLTKVDGFSADKTDLLDRIFALKRVCHAALVQSIEKDQSDSVHLILNKLLCLCETEDAINKGANTKLLMTNLLVNL